MKKTVLFLLITAILVGVCGCMNNSNSSKNSIEVYLNKKYQQAFTFVSQGDDVWSAKTKTEVYADQSGNKFTVKYSDGYCTDNYYSVMFDSYIQEHYNTNSSTDIKVFVSTQSVFSNNNKSYMNWNQYFDDCSIVNIAIYTKDDANFNAIANNILSCSKTTISAVIYVVAAEDYENVSQYNNEYNVLRSGSFWIENGVITSTSWEE